MTSRTEASARGLYSFAARTPQWIVSTVGNGLVGVIGVATSSLLARQLGPAGRGQFAEAMLWTGLLVTAGTFVNSQTVAYYWAKARGEGGPEKILSVALGGAGATALVLMPVALLLNYLALGMRGKASYTPANLYVLVIPLTVCTLCISGVLIAERRFLSYWGTRLANAIVFLVCLASALGVGHFGVIPAILSTLTATTVATILGIALVAKRVPIGVRWDTPLLKPMLRFGAQTSMTNLPYQLNMRLDQLFMSVLLPATQLGLYVAAFSWSSMLAFVGGGISMVMLSRSVAADVNDRSQLDKLVQQFRIVTCVTLAIGVCAALLAPVGIVFLFGEAFAPSIVPGVLLCFAAVLLNANLVLHELTRGLGMPEIGMRAELCGLVGTILLLLLLLRPFGGLGAALTSIASYGGIMTSMLISISRRLDITIGSMLLPRADDVRLLIAAISRVGGRSRTSTAPVAPS